MGRGAGSEAELTVGEELVRVKEVGNSIVYDPLRTFDTRGKEQDWAVVGGSGRITRLRDGGNIRSFPDVWDLRLG